jgi:ABC-type branched-subunit amino acid transport system substrate-binding protein
MSALIAVLKEAGSSANDRSTIVRDFLSIKNRSSVLGTYSINGSGDTNLGPFVFSRLESAKLVPFKFLQVQG